MGWRELETTSARYNAYITGPEWLERCDEYFQSHERRCAGCNRKTGIVLHHVTYDRLGDELDADLVPVCKKHHQQIHDEHQARADHEDLAVVTEWVLSDIRKTVAVKKLR